MFIEFPSAISNYNNKHLLYLLLTQYLTVDTVPYCPGSLFPLWRMAHHFCKHLQAFCGHPKALHRFELESLRPWREGGRNKTQTHPLTAGFGGINSIKLFRIFWTPDLPIEEPFHRKEWCWPRSFRDGLGRILLLQNPSWILVFPYLPHFLENHFTSLQI